MRIVGIDASTNMTGIASFYDGKYENHILIDCHKTKDVYQRIPMMTDQICKYIDTMLPVDKIIMEKSVLRSNVDTVQKLANIAGAIMLYAYQHGIEFEHPVPSEWRAKCGLRQSNKIKRAVLKAEAILAVKNEYGLDVTDDEAESILIARSGFNLSKLDHMADDVDLTLWND